jgi:hypothetical protein
MFYVLGSINTATNIICCVVMGLFLRLIRQIVSQISVKVSSGSVTTVSAEITLNTLVTSLHIGLIITYTILNFLEEILYPQMSLLTE